MYKVETVGLVEMVYNSIKEMILNKTLVPGQKLVQEEMATLLGVSRTPVLAAFSKLEKEWLVKNIPRRGFYINKMSPQEKIYLFDIRLRIEPLAANKAAEFGSLEDKEILLDLALNAKDIIIDRDYMKFNAHDYSFHKKIMEMSHNTILNMMLSSYNIVCLSNQNGNDIDYEYSVNGHIKIAEAILSGDSLLADKAMEEHIKNGIQRLKDLNNNE